MENLLKVENLTKVYPGVVALDKVSLEVQRGECLALVGENGAGKSTLIKAITGAIAPDGGTITFENETYSEMTPTQSHSIGISAIYQEFVLCPPLSAGENIYMGQRPMAGPFQNERMMLANAQAILDRFQVSNFKANMLIRDLSVAYRQMVEIAKAIAHNAKLLIMDEPTAPLSDHEVEVLFRIIDELKSNGVTIIYISHRLDELYRVSDRVTVMRDGKVITTQNTDDLTKDQIIAYMVGRELTNKFDERTDELGPVLLEAKNLGGNGVQPFSLTLRAGEVLGLGGLVGAGRTEYAQLLFGSARKDCGELYLEGERINLDSPVDAVKHGIGMVTEDRKATGVMLRMSVRENIVVSILKRISSRGFVNRKVEHDTADQQIAALRIKTPGKEQLVGNLSGGNQQKTALAKWLANDSKVLILDEPTRGIDVGAKKEIYNLINELAAQGKGIIVISSDMEEIMGITDRMHILYEGKNVGMLEKEDYTQERILQYASGEVKG